MTAHGDDETLPDVGTVDEREPVHLEEVDPDPSHQQAANRHLLSGLLPARFRKGAK